jgi:hypothetical protein
MSNQFVNIQDNRVLDVANSKDEEGRAVIVSKNNGTQN